MVGKFVFRFTAENALVKIIEILYRNEKGQACKVLCASVNLKSAHLAYPLLVFGKRVKLRVTLGYDAQALARRSHVGSYYAQFLAVGCYLLLPHLARVVYVVNVDHEQARRHSMAVLALASDKRRLPRYGWQTLLQRSFALGYAVERLDHASAPATYLLACHRLALRTYGFEIIENHFS
jgi:hypothetical protein